MLELRTYSTVKVFTSDVGQCWARQNTAVKEDTAERCSFVQGAAPWTSLTNTESLTRQQRGAHTQALHGIH